MEPEIIIGYDPEQHGGDVLELGRLLANVLGAKPIVVTAVPWPAQVDAPGAGQDEPEHALVEELAAAGEALAEHEPETRAVVSSSPAATINEIAESTTAARAIVLGSSHRGPVGQTLLGSVGESLMHGAPCAVAIAPRGYGGQGRQKLKRIGVAFDETEEAEAALQTAIGLAGRCHARVTLLLVAGSPHYGYAAAWSVLTEGEIVDAERENKQRLLEATRTRIPAGVDLDDQILTGDAGRELARVSGDFDLLIAGSRAYGPLRRTLLGSTTRRLIRAAACPVLVLPRGAGADPLIVQVEAEATTSVEPPAAG